jgi:hypothetical protein
MISRHLAPNDPGASMVRVRCGLLRSLGEWAEKKLPLAQEPLPGSLLSEFPLHGKSA